MERSFGTDWRGADRVMNTSLPKIEPTRDPSGRLTAWTPDTEMPRAGDILLTSLDAVVIGDDDDDRTPSHISMVEGIDGQNRLNTIDGNVSFLPATDTPCSSSGSHVSNAVSGRGYDLNADVDNYYYNQSRIVCVVRITDREGNFDPPATSGDAASSSASTTACTGDDLLACLRMANTQVAAVLNNSPDPSVDPSIAPFDPTLPVRSWMRTREATHEEQQTDGSCIAIPNQR
jgi:hypothetical protein